MRRFFSAILAGLAAIACAAPSAHAWPLFQPEPRVGRPAPDFTAAMLDGRKISLADYRGQVLVINFWATWCGPCKRELPLLDAYYKVQQKFGLRVLAVTTENSAPLSQLQPLAKVLTIPMVRYMHGYHELEGVPTNYVIDRAGVVRYAQAGAFDLTALNTLLVPLLKEPAPPPPPPVTTSAALAPAGVALNTLPR